jgi:integrase
MNDQDHWTVEFYDFTTEPPQLDTVQGLAGLGDLHEHARKNGARHGTPVLLGPAGHVDPRVNLYFRVDAMAGCSATTWRRYAYALVVWLDFLEVSGRSWSEATARDIEAFKDWRLTDLRNEERVQPTSFDTDRAALNSFYTWAAARYGVLNPVPTVPMQSRQRPRGSDADLASAHGSRDGLRPAGSRRRQVKWMLRPAFEQWRHIGLCGYGFDELRRPGWRGANEDRDAAFVDGLYGTGLRLSEWASVLDVELPTIGGQRFPKAWLSAACIKGGREGREYRVPRSVLSSVTSYTDPVEGSRVLAIRRAQRAGRYERVPFARIVTGYNARSRTVSIEGPHGAVPLSVDVIGPDERRSLFRRTPHGLEPLAVWLGVDGLPKKAHGWEDTFQAANERIAELWVQMVAPDLTGQRREDRKAECPLWARPHMCRHSFALKWFSILSFAWRQRLQGFSDTEMHDMREQFGSVWYQLSTLMGHQDPATTRDIYLEPFTGLEVDYLMSLLDGEETAAVDALSRALSADSGRTLDAVASPGQEGDQ